MAPTPRNPPSVRSSARPHEYNNQESTGKSTGWSVSNNGRVYTLGMPTHPSLMQRVHYSQL